VIPEDISYVRIGRGRVVHATAVEVAVMPSYLAVERVSGWPNVHVAIGREPVCGQRGETRWSRPPTGATRLCRNCASVLETIERALDWDRRMTEAATWWVPRVAALRAEAADRWGSDVAGWLELA
jgi:hypothetical protein